MQFKENAEVLTSEGRKVGRIDRVVIEPKTKTATHLVVKKGILFTRDKVIPMDDVDSADEDRVVLKKGADKPDEFPNFEETHHIPVDHVKSFRLHRQDWAARQSIWHHPQPGIGWWGEVTYPRYPKPEFTVQTERNIPPGTVALEEGAKVVGADDEAVGRVERVFTEPEEHRATHLLVSKGMLVEEKKLIPTLWVDSVFEDEIRLSVESDLIKDLPVYDAHSAQE